MKEIGLYSAIREMRRMSGLGQTFSLAHYTYDRQRRKSDGLRVVNKAKLRPAASGDDVSLADFKLFYTDLDAQKPLQRVCWQPLLAYFNGMKVKMEGYYATPKRK